MTETAGVPDQWHKVQPETSQLAAGSQCILLSFFSGVEVAALAFTQLVGEPLLHLSWEVDESCCEVIRHHFPAAHLRGDVLQEDPRQVAQLVDRHDPHGAALVVFVAAPPCPDFSIIHDSGQGLNGPEGSKFDSYVKLVQEIEAHLGGRSIPLT